MKKLEPRSWLHLAPPGAGAELEPENLDSPGTGAELEPGKFESPGAGAELEPGNLENFRTLGSSKFDGQIILPVRECLRLKYLQFIHFYCKRDTKKKRFMNFILIGTGLKTTHNTCYFLNEV